MRKTLQLAFPRRFPVFSDANILFLSFGLCVTASAQREPGTKHEALYFCDPDGHLLEVVTLGVWSI